MGTLFKRSRKKPIPAGATIKDYRGVPSASWIDQRTGRTQNAKLTDDGNQIVKEDRYYTLEWFDHSGNRQRKSSGTTDKDAAQRLLNQLETEAMKRREGLIDPEQERLATEGRRTIDSHLNDYRAKMLTDDSTTDHVDNSIRLIRDIATVCGFKNIADIKADPVNHHVAELQKRLSARTIQARLTAIKGFTRWLTVHQKLTFDPLASIKRPDPRTDRRYRRRMLLPREWTWLRSITLQENVVRLGMIPAERILLYATAIQTGLRQKELRALIRSSLFLEVEKPYIRAKAGSTKNGKDACQYIKLELVSELRAHVATKAPQAPVFTLPVRTKVAAMLKADLAATRKAWLADAKDSEERLQRAQEDFLCDVNHDGEHLDFHSLRHTCGAWLALSGAHPKVVQEVMRHCVITLTMDNYGHLLPGQQAEAILKLPDLLTDDPSIFRATGTDDFVASNGQQLGQQLNGRPRQRVADRGEEAAAPEPTDDSHNVLPILTFDEDRQDMATNDNWPRRGSNPHTAYAIQDFKFALRLTARYATLRKQRKNSGFSTVGF